MILDIIAVILVAAFVIGGYKKGFVQSLGSLLGFVLTILILARIYPWLMSKVDGFLSKVIIFILALIAISLIVHLAIWIVEKIFGVFSFIPGSKTLGRLLGSGLGLVSGLLFASFLMWMTIKLSVISPWLSGQIDQSRLLAPLMTIAYIWIPLVPKIYREIKSHL
ncbi:MAG TPA: CvpA family protein [Candidatus Bipolaricaulota bacterium]|nr:CvpA family protein [Candidatus Bipolaricaulota bacterium]